MPDLLEALLDRALATRAELFDARRQAAFRLFNGFYEGWPELAIDLYARTLVIHNYADAPEAAEATVRGAQAYYRERLPWITAVVVKTRNAPAPEARRGALVFGEKPDHTVRDPQGGPWYAVELRLNRDASLYLDTRNLRAWATAHLRDKTVLNTFAYTGSLGVAAQAGGARRVVHLDRNREFLNIAKTSYTLNGFPIAKANFRAGDFFQQVAQFKHSGERFDCVFLDPPFFSTDHTGTIDLNTESRRLINKVRPLIDDGGWLVAVNNALFVSGAAYLQTLEALCADGYLSIEELLPVPPDFTGYPNTRIGAPPVDPAPFNHSTKMAVVKVRRK